ncbi:MAG TPA: cupredoxin domain-containing protein [Candidatus Limnocylindrales bacterium]|jgi:plastocyanin
MTSRSRVGVLVAIVAIVLAACSSSSATAAPASQAPAASAAGSPAAAGACAPSTDAAGTPAEIKNFTFPTGLSIKAGDAVAWTNGDSANHTVTFDDGSCSTPVDAGATVVVTYLTPGTHAFHCTIHSSMTGTIEVK